MERYRIAIIGGGPGGMSAGARAAARGESHIVLERAAHSFAVLRAFMKGKAVMATPDRVPLRSDLPFGYGSREAVLEGLDHACATRRVNLRCNAEVTAITGGKGAFRIELRDGCPIAADVVVLAIGLGGNRNRLAIPGADRPEVQYQLTDPAAHQGEHIVVIGGGDSGVENALALAAHNQVSIVNRSSDFSRARRANIEAIERAIEAGRIVCYADTAPVAVDAGAITLLGPAGEVRLACDRVVAQIGGAPPRAFLERCGVRFAACDASARPELSDRYETSIPGFYIIGALGGQAVIKQAMNQGYEVVEAILGHAVPHVDDALLRQNLAPLGGAIDVEQVLLRIRRSIPIFSQLNSLQLRELLLDTVVHRPLEGDTVFERGDARNTFYTVLNGSVRVVLDPNRPAADVVIGKGEFFGELGLISGRRRGATIKAGAGCVLLETSRRAMVRLTRSVEAVRRQMDAVAMLRQVQNHIAPHLPPAAVRELTAAAEIRSFAKDEVILREGETGSDLHLIRSGSVIVSKSIAGREVVLTYVHAGNYIGEIALLTDGVRTATVKAAVATETIRLDGAKLKARIAEDAALQQRLQQQYRARIEYNDRVRGTPEVSSVLEFLARVGGNEAVDMLLIDESKCVRCDNCETACAETHAGIGRLDREAGPTLGQLHVPTSCRHCEHPHCMKDCPPDAIHRLPYGEVVIDEAACIGCGNCQANCPYGVIQLAAEPPKRGLLQRLIDGFVGDADAPVGRKAYKCDMCKGIDGGPACVNACPTGAATRISPDRFASLADLGRPH